MNSEYQLSYTCLSISHKTAYLNLKNISQVGHYYHQKWVFICNLKMYISFAEASAMLFQNSTLLYVN